VFFGSTLYGGRVAFRPAPVSWRQRPEDMELIATVVRELATEIAAEL
jgi:hypothetical protein